MAGKKNFLAVFASFFRITLLESTKLSQKRVQQRTKKNQNVPNSLLFRHIFVAKSFGFSQATSIAYKNVPTLFQRLPGSIAPAGSGNDFSRFWGPFLWITHLESTKRSQNRLPKRTKTYRTRRVAGPLKRYGPGTRRPSHPPQASASRCSQAERAQVRLAAYFGGAGGVNISRLRPGSGFGFGLGAFFASRFPLSLFPMAQSMTQKPAPEKPVHA